MKLGTFVFTFEMMWLSLQSHFASCAIIQIQFSDVWVTFQQCFLVIALWLRCHCLSFPCPFKVFPTSVIILYLSMHHHFSVLSMYFWRFCRFYFSIPIIQLIAPQEHFIVHAIVFYCVIIWITLSIHSPFGIPFIVFWIPCKIHFIIIWNVLSMFLHCSLCLQLFLLWLSMGCTQIGFTCHKIDDAVPFQNLMTVFVGFIVFNFYVNYTVRQFIVLCF